MQRLEVSVAVRPIYGSLGVKRLIIPLINNYSRGIFMSGLSINLYTRSGL